MKLAFELSDKSSSFGNHFIVGLSGPTLSDLDKRILNTLQPAGVLLLKRNIVQDRPYREWLGALKKLLGEIKSYSERENMFITIDHEGGRVMRTPPPLTVFPEPMSYGKKAAEVATAMAIELKSIGVNVSWAPLADIHSNANNPIIGRRSFGHTADEVSSKAIIFAQALMKNGVLGCAKHFPGHGDTSTDSHFELPTVNLSESELRERELRPFKALVDIDIPFVMTAHILYPKLDPAVPATMSPKILKKFLRDQMGYEGIILADDLDMKAVAAQFNQTETISHAINAGCDMFIVARYPDGNSDRPLTLAKNMAHCLTKKLLSEDALHACFQRIQKVANRLGPSEVSELSEDVFRRHAELRADGL